MYAVQLVGRSSRDHIVVFDGPRTLIGQILPVRIEKVDAFTLYRADLDHGPRSTFQGSPDDILHGLSGGICPELAAYVDPGLIEFLDKEVFTDVTHGERSRSGLGGKGEVPRKAAWFLICGPQGRRQKVFGQRMFTYFARFHEKHDLPVSPIALFSYQTPFALSLTSTGSIFPIWLYSNSGIGWCN